MQVSELTLILLGATVFAPSAVKSCNGIVASLEELIQRKIDESLEDLRGSGELCHLGMRSHLIPDSSISVSSFWGRQHEPYQGRLDNQAVSGTSVGSWVAAKDVVGEWLQVDFGSVKAIAGVITQGRPQTTYDQWIRTYKVSCATDQKQFAFVQENGRDKVFTGNTDQWNQVYNRLPQVIYCRYIRIYPQTWHKWVSMRAEFVPGACFNNPHLAPK